MLQTITKNNLIIFTGGPGGGKTSLINELAKNGVFKVQEEVARKVIRQQVAAGKDGVPWKNSSLFKDLMFEGELQNFLSCNDDSNSIILSDRSLLDVIAYSKIINQPIESKLLEAARKYRYHKQVFITPPWKEIYIQDEERKQTFKEAIEVYTEIRKVYEEFQYELIKLPLVCLNQRVHFVENIIGKYFDFL